MLVASLLRLGLRSRLLPAGFLRNVCGLTVACATHSVRKDRLLSEEMRSSTNVIDLMEFQVHHRADNSLSLILQLFQVSQIFIPSGVCTSPMRKRRSVLVLDACVTGTLMSSIAVVPLSAHGFDHTGSRTQDLLRAYQRQ